MALPVIPTYYIVIHENSCEIPVLTSFCASGPTKSDINICSVMKGMESCGLWLSYLAEVAPGLDVADWINNPEDLKVPFHEGVPVAIRALSEERNIIIEKSLNVYATASSQFIDAAIRLHSVKWDYVMCYGEDNVFDFRSLQGKVCTLQGNNASGKSSFLDVVCLGMFGQPSNIRNMQYCKKSFGRFVNDQRPSDKSMVIALTFEISGIVYELVRTYNGKDKYGTLRQADQCTFIAEGLTAIDNWVRDKIGTIDDVMMGNMISQIDTENFLYSKQEVQKGILDKVLHHDIGAVSAFGKVIKDAHVAHTMVVTAYKTSLAAIDGIIPSVAESQMTKGVAELRESVVHLKDQVAQHQQRRDALALKLNGADITVTVTDDASQLNKMLTKAQKKLQTFSDLSDEDKQNTAALQDDQYQEYCNLQHEYTKLTNIDICDDVNLEECTTQFQKRLNFLTETAPTFDLSDDMLLRKSIEYESWASSQDATYLSDPDALDIYKTELANDIEYHQGIYEKLIAKAPDKLDMNAPRPSQMPSDVDLARDYIGELAALNALKDEKKQRLSVIDVHLNTKSYTKWKREYDIWYGQVKDVIGVDGADGADGDISELQKQLEEYEKYISVMTAKEDIRRTLHTDFTSLSKELATLDEYPHNPECWACKQQPMRLRHDHVTETLQGVTKSLAKVNKYLEQAGNVDLDKLREDARVLKQRIDTLGFYHATYQRKMDECDRWKEYKCLQDDIGKLDDEISGLQAHAYSVSHMRYDKWSCKVETIKAKLASMKSELARIDRFFSEFPHYHSLADMIHTEKRARADAAIYAAEKAEILVEVGRIESYTRRCEIDEILCRMQSEMTVKRDILDRVREWQELETQIKALKYRILVIEYQRVSADVEESTNRYIDKRSRLLAYEKEVMEASEIEQTRAIYNLELTVMEERQRKLAILEEKFVGDKSNSDGFREYMYNSQVIPLLQQTVNEFLGSFETLKVSIGYSNKALSYTITEKSSNSDDVEGHSFDMSSGYQRFVVGMAFRAALARMNAIGHRIKHMFIDEGFNACDSANIAKIPAILRALQAFVEYDSIIVVTHYPAIRESVDMSITITRSNESSLPLLQWGTVPVASQGKRSKKKPQSRKSES